MRRAIHLICLASGLVLSACAERAVWYREGVPQAQLNADSLQCRVDAVGSVPVAERRGVTPVRMTPLRTHCRDFDGKTLCTTTGGKVYGGQSYSYDANEGLRDEVVAQCMSDKGYRSVTLPACSSQVAGAAPRRLTTVPPLSEESCLLPAANGRIAIHTPG